jgi:hypothetical protein
MERIDLVVPLNLVVDLQIPSLAVTNGAVAPDWVEVPLGRRRSKRKPSLRLPLDPRSARSARRYLRLAPWSPLSALVALVVWGAWTFGHLPWRGGLVAVLVAWGVRFAWLLLQTPGLPKQWPYRTRFGDLRIPKVPVAVAQEWVAQNPGVTATDEPPPRPHSRRFYAGWSVCLLLAAIGLFVVLANDGREDFILLWMLVAVLFFTGVSAALKTQPPA